MSQQFTTGVRFNHNFGILETLSFVGEGAGAALYILAMITGFLPVAVLGILFVVGAVLALRAHLGKPQRGWRAVFRLGTSWVSRGVLMMSAFLGLSTLSVAAAYVPALAPFQKPLAGAAMVLAVAVIIYAGMLMRSMRAIRLWRGAFVPLAFSAHSLATGATVTWALAPWFGQDLGQTAWLPSMAIGCLLLAAGLSVMHLTLAERSVGVQASLDRLFKGDLRQQFIWGAGGAGLVLPLAGLLLPRLLATGLAPQAGAALLAAIALGRLYGDFAYRNSVVVAGAYEPVFPTAPSRAFVAARG